MPVEKAQGGKFKFRTRASQQEYFSDRVIVDNFFCRILSLWNIMSAKCTLAEDMYDTIASMCLGITNYIVRNNPLRIFDGQ